MKSSSGNVSTVKKPAKKMTSPSAKNAKGKKRGLVIVITGSGKGKDHFRFRTGIAGCRTGI